MHKKTVILDFISQNMSKTEKKKVHVHKYNVCNNTFTYVVFLLQVRAFEKLFVCVGVYGPVNKEVMLSLSVKDHLQRMF